MIRKIYLNHTVILLLLITLIIFSIIFNLLVPKNLVVFSGEYLFSFDYIAHFKNLLANYIFNPKEFIFLTTCRDCPIYYQGFSWYMAWLMALLSIGQIFHLHPVVFYFLLTIIMQIIPLYLLISLFFKHYSTWAFIIAACFFILSPYKFYLVPPATLDGVIYGLTAGLVCFWMYLLSNIKSLPRKNFYTLIIAFGLYCAFCFNIALAYIPLIFYGLIFISFPFLVNIKSNLIRFFLLIFCVLLIVCMLNLPFIFSQLVTGNGHNLTSYDSLSWSEALSAGLVTAGAPVWEVIFVFFSIIVLFFLSDISRSRKFLFSIAYFLLAFLMTGGKVAHLSFYHFIFAYLPLMNNIRALYRLFVFEYIILFFVLYTGMKQLLRSRFLFLRLTSFFLGIFFFVVCFYYIPTNLNLFHIGSLPNAYSQTNVYLQHLHGKKVYFPSIGPDGKEFMSGNYTWLSLWPVRNPTVYANPFTSLFYVPGIVFTEGYQLDTPYEGQMRSLITYQGSPQPELKFLSNLGIKYLIVDKYYLWNKNFPLFRVDEIGKYANLDKRFGDIEIYSLPDRSKQCKPSYGDYLLGYCYSENNPEYLINKSVRDYVLDHFVLQNSPYLIKKDKGTKVPDNIVNIIVRERVIEQRMLIPYTVYQADNTVSDIYKTIISPGSYTFYIPVLQMSDKGRLFRDTQIQILLDGKVLRTISPYENNNPGFNWQELSLTTQKKQILSINSTGNGLIVFSNPLLIPDQKMQDVSKKINSYNKKVILISSH